MYHFLTISVVMRDCESLEDAKQKCGQLLPQYPDENTTYMESWEIVTVEPRTGTIPPDYPLE